MAHPTRILAINQNRIFRDGICALIEMQPDMELVASAEDADTAVHLFALTLPDLTVMDLDLPERNGVKAIHSIRSIDPYAWVIGLVTYEWDQCGREALEAGASTVLAKDRIGETLLPLIRARQDNPGSYEIPIGMELSDLRLK